METVFGFRVGTVREAGPYKRESSLPGKRQFFFGVDFFSAIHYNKKEIERCKVVAGIAGRILHLFI